MGRQLHSKNGIEKLLYDKKDRYGLTYEDTVELSADVLKHIAKIGEEYLKELEGEGGQGGFQVKELLRRISGDKPTEPTKDYEQL
jgi:hypothetical protein